MKKLFLLVAAMLMSAALYTAVAQEWYVDDNGILRSRSDRKEAAFFGANYTVPFAHAYRQIERMGISHEEAIDRDIYHMARLGFTGYRVHIWDVEISDKDGGLINNHHLQMFDYLLAKFKERGFKMILTLQTNFGDGYPERDIRVGGFTYDYTKCSVGVDPEAIKKQERYVNELISHVNPYTGLAWAKDPDIIGYEINNEPCNPNDPKEVTAFINRIVNSIRKTGSKQIIYYNASHNTGNQFKTIEAFFAAKINGGTYQWYPTGLVANRTRKGNFLPNVDNYFIPFEGVKNYDKMTKMVYEYDAADVANSYIHPAVARTFKSTGMQWITQFAYDPLDMAWMNTEYQTHFINMAYTPSKAIGMRIAAEVTYKVPAYTEFPKYPADTTFFDFRVSYNEDLSEYVTNEMFLYSNNTNSAPSNPSLLKEIAGVGCSPIVNYDGNGAYFLDQLEDGVWRLEVMPDCIWLSDPFNRASPKKRVARLFWNTWDMKVSLPGLGNSFSFRGVNSGNSVSGNASAGTFKVRPGVYILTASGKNSSAWNADSKFKNFKVGEYVAPQSDDNNTLVFQHEATQNVVAGKPVDIKVVAAAGTLPSSITVRINAPAVGRGQGGGQPTPPQPIVLQRTHAYTYEGQIPANMVNAGTLSYYLIVEHEGKTYTYPSGETGQPGDWDFYSNDQYHTNVVTAAQPFVLYSATTSAALENYTLGSARQFTRTVATANPAVKVTEMGSESVPAGSKIISRVYLDDMVDGLRGDLGGYRNLVIRAASVKGINKLDVGFLTTDGFTYTASANLSNNMTEIRVPISSLIQTTTLLLPGPFPGFVKRTFEPDQQIRFDINKIEFLEISTPDEIGATDIAYSIENVWLE